MRDKYIPLKREYIKSLNGRSNVQLTDGGKIRSVTSNIHLYQFLTCRCTWTHYPDL